MERILSVDNQRLIKTGQTDADKPDFGGLTSRRRFATLNIMTHSAFPRRRFLQASLAAGVGSLAGAGRAAPGARPLRLGAPAFAKTDDPVELARWHRANGYRAAYCPPLDMKDAARIRAVEKAFAEADVVIAEVGRWCNLTDPDPVKRRQNLAKVTEGLALADAVGARCCVDIAGSFNPEVWYGPHPDNFSPAFFDAAVENARAVIDAVKPTRAAFTYEMMGWCMPESPERYLALIKAIDRPAFAVHLDPCNLINSPDKIYRNTELLNRCFDLLGDKIVSCHAKDLAWEIALNVHFREVRPGTGVLDYATFLRRLAALPTPPPLMIEHLKGAEEYAAAAAHIQAAGAAIGLAFAP
ncbi:MAG: TIM barrel protein [Kiritimatiellia bacterium]|jgi:sugar phosphate isomerase/epimerase